jgi:hypothetical protein
MMLVNSNLKQLLGGQSLNIGLVMLRHVAVANQQEGRREFSAAHVAEALLTHQMNPEGMTMWLHMNKEEAALPLIKTLEAQTEVCTLIPLTSAPMHASPPHLQPALSDLRADPRMWCGLLRRCGQLAPAQYQFKHLSFQEGLFAQHLLMQAEEGWSQWDTNEKAAEFLNNPCVAVHALWLVHFSSPHLPTLPSALLQVHEQHVPHCRGLPGHPPCEAPACVGLLF